MRKYLSEIVKDWPKNWANVYKSYSYDGKDFYNNKD